MNGLIIWFFLITFSTVGGAEIPPALVQAYVSNETRPIKSKQGCLEAARKAEEVYNQGFINSPTKLFGAAKVECVALNRKQAKAYFKMRHDWEAARTDSDTEFPIFEDYTKAEAGDSHGK